jgi:hypothetical protein
MNSQRLPLLRLSLLLITGPLAAQPAARFPVEENGLQANRINIVFLSEGYTAAQLPQFAAHVNTARTYLFSREPWRQYRAFCNVYRIEIASNESGTDNGAGGGLRDTYFESGFLTPSVPQLLTFTASGQSKAFALLNQLLPEYDLAILLVNDPTYGGSGGSISVASTHASSPQLVEHEIGHSFADLADEYDFDYPIYTPRESYNATQQSDRNLVRWKSWIEASTPVPTPETTAYDPVVGVFEGANYRTTGWYRPHNNSLMRNLGRPVGAVNREKFILSYYDRISPVETHSPAELAQTVATSITLSFSVTPMVPSEGPTLTVQWRVNGLDQTGAVHSTFEIPSTHLGNGTHTVTAVVRDPTPLVRDDPTGSLTEEITWTLSLSAQPPATLADWRLAYGPDTSNPAGDGLNNLAKYALGLDPTQVATPDQRPSASLTELAPALRYITLTIPRTALRPDILYSVQSSGDLQHWNSGPGHTVVLDDSPNRLVVRDAVPTSDATRRFLEFNVSER